MMQKSTNLSGHRLFLLLYFIGWPQHFWDLWLWYQTRG